MNSPYIMPGVSDGGAHVKFITPAIYPTEVLSWLVRETGMLTLEEAHFRLERPDGLGSRLQGSWNPAGGDGGGHRRSTIPTPSKPGRVRSLYDLPANEWRRVQKADGLQTHPGERRRKPSRMGTARVPRRASCCATARPDRQANHRDGRAFLLPSLILTTPYNVTQSCERFPECDPSTL